MVLVEGSVPGMGQWFVGQHGSQVSRTGRPCVLVPGQLLVSLVVGGESCVRHVQVGATGGPSRTVMVTWVGAGGGEPSSMTVANWSGPFQVKAM